MGKRLDKKDQALAQGTFGNLTVTGTGSKGRIRCRCFCGKDVTYQVGNLLKGNITCCGCTFGGFGKKNALKVRYFGKLEVLSVNKGKKDNTVNCKCTCGREEKVSPRKLFLKETACCTLCKDTRTGAMTLVDEAVKSSFRKDMLVAESRNMDRTTRGKAFINMRCDCGTLKAFEYRSLLKLEYGSCGCYKPKTLTPSPTTQKALAIGEFTNWTVLNWSGDDTRYVDCLCKCGKTGRIRADSLLVGDATSCGCRARELCSARFKGKFKPDAVTRHPLYSVYKGMLARCNRESNQDYMHYGGRGITVCDRWQSPKRDITGFLNFLEDMETGYEEGLEIERVDVNGNYEKANCTWICRKSQVNNLRCNRMLKGYGIELTVAEWGALLNLNPKILDDRINHLKWKGDLETLLSISPRDRRHTLLYKGEVCTATQVWEREGYTLGQRNARLNTYGDSIAAFEAEGIIVSVVKEREKDYLSFEDALQHLRNKERDNFEDWLLIKIDTQLKKDG